MLNNRFAFGAFNFTGITMSNFTGITMSKFRSIITSKNINGSPISLQEDVS